MSTELLAVNPIIKQRKESTDRRHGDSALTMLKETNDILKKKLRKYHTNCKHLEREKSSIVAVLNSSVLNHESSNNTVNNTFDSVKSLCEKKEET